MGGAAGGGMINNEGALKQLEGQTSSVQGDSYADHPGLEAVFGGGAEMEKIQSN